MPLGEAVEEPGHDQQRRGEEEARREPEDGPSCFRRAAGGEGVQEHLQEPHDEVGEPEDVPVGSEGAGDG